MRSWPLDAAQTSGVRPACAAGHTAAAGGRGRVSPAERARARGRTRTAGGGGRLAAGWRVAAARARRALSRGSRLAPRARSFEPSSCQPLSAAANSAKSCAGPAELGRA